jgi:hypothetical protein
LSNHSYSFLDILIGRGELGIPSDWSTVENWLNKENSPCHPGKENDVSFSLKNPEIPVLKNYGTAPDKEFWDFFPHRELPERPTTRINIRNLEKLVRMNENDLTKSELKRAKRVISDLKWGAEACQKTCLPPIATENSPTSVTFGSPMTDKIATWVKNGVVAGPFDFPPVEKFRCNPLIAIVRNSKIRPVINMSGPKGFSFNDNLDKSKLEKVHMTTAKEFSYSLKESGKDTVFSKFDIQEAYKLMPAKVCDYRLQGFKWLGKFFLETQQTFGAVPSVCNFDRLGNTIVALVAVTGKVPRESISRTLDDFQGLGTQKNGNAEKFASAIKNVCGFINVPLADTCPEKEKAFELEKRGSVLGIGFDSTTMTWYLGIDKANKIIRRCMDTCKMSHISLKQTQELMGSINDFGQMNKFLKFFKYEGNRLLSKFGKDENILLPIPDKMKQSVMVVCNAAESAKKGLPICSRRQFPSLAALTFYTDAAGAKYCWRNRKFQLIEENNRGVACIGGEDIGNVWTWSRMSWPEGFLEKKDEKGVEYGRKSTTLESIGVLLPFIAFPEKLAGKELMFYVDNIAVVYGWEKGGVKKDESATEILKTVHVLSSYLGCRVYVRHIHRVSNDLADLADDLTRRSIPEKAEFREALDKAEFKPLETSWMNHFLCKNDTPLYELLLEKIKKKY